MVQDGSQHGVLCSLQGKPESRRRLDERGAPQVFDFGPLES